MLALLLLAAAALSAGAKAAVKGGYTTRTAENKDTNFIVMYSDGDGISASTLGIGRRSQGDTDGPHWVEATQEEVEAMLQTSSALKVYVNDFPFAPKVFSDSCLYDDPGCTAWYFQPSSGLPSLGLEGLWEKGLTGKGVTVLVIDDSVSFAHPELSGKKNESYSYNYKTNSKLTDPDSPDQTHGTSVAGVIAAVPGNADCGVGVATGVDVAARVAIYQGVKPISLINALQNDIGDVSVINNGWGIDPCDVGQLVGADIGQCHLLPNIGVEQSFESVVTKGRSGRGSILVFAAGNSGETPGADTNLCPLTRSPYTLTVGAVLKSGRYAPYSVPGKSVLISAPSGNLDGSDGIVAPRTVYDASSGTLVHDCITNFTGTSAAAPIVSGIVSMILQQNPLLSYQDVKQVLIHSARKIDESDPSWTTNLAGVSYSKHYGFGYIDAQAATDLAAAWPPTTTYMNQMGVIPTNWTPKDDLTNYQKYISDSNIVLPAKTTVIIPFYFKNSDSVIIESMVAVIDGIADRAVGIYLAYVGDDSDMEETIFSEIIDVTKEGSNATNTILQMIMSSLDGQIDTSVELLTYEYAGMVSTGMWELKIVNNGSSEIKIPVDTISLRANGLPSVIQLDSVEYVYASNYLSSIIVKPVVNDVESVAYKYGRGMYMYIKVGDNEPVIVKDETGEPLNINPLESVIEIPWKSEYGCPSANSTGEVDLSSCKKYDAPVQIMLVNAEGNHSVFEFTTSQCIGSKKVTITVTISYEDHLTCGEEEEEIREEEEEIEEGNEEEEHEETGTEEESEEGAYEEESEEHEQAPEEAEEEEGDYEEGEEEEELVPIPPGPEEEEELCPPEEEEECIVPEEEEKGEEEEEECIVIEEEEEECYEELYPEEAESYPEEEEEEEIPGPIFPPDEEETSDGFDIRASKATKIASALIAMFVALMV